MNALILGGTGAMGEPLVIDLAENRFDVIVTSRYKKEDKQHIRYVEINTYNEFDCIVYFMSYHTGEFLERYELFLRHTKQYVFLSSARCYADSQLITEESYRLIDICTDREYLKTDEYAIAKGRQENILINSGKTNWTIIRPYNHILLIAISGCNLDFRKKSCGSTGCFMEELLFLAGWRCCQSTG